MYIHIVIEKSGQLTEIISVHRLNADAAKKAQKMCDEQPGEGIHYSVITMEIQ